MDGTVVHFRQPNCLSGVCNGGVGGLFAEEFINLFVSSESMKIKGDYYSMHRIFTDNFSFY